MACNILCVTLDCRYKYSSLHVAKRVPCYIQVRIIGIILCSILPIYKTINLSFRIYIIHVSYIHTYIYIQTRTLARVSNKIMEKYEVLKQVGEGSFGQVYKAKKRSDGEIVAFKVIRKVKR